MKALCSMNVNDYSIGTMNTNLPENTITLNIILPLNVTSAYLKLTGINDESETTSTLTLESNEAEYVLPEKYYYSGIGTIKIQVLGSDGFESNEVSMLVNGEYTGAENLFVETSGDTFIIKKITESSGGGGSGGTSDYNDLSNKPSLNTTSTASLNPNSVEEIKDVVNLHKISKTGAYSDLIGTPDIPTSTEDLENNSGFIDNTVDNLINYYKMSETYSKDEVNDLISSFLKMDLVAGNYSGSCEITDGEDVFLLQWGRAILEVVAGQITTTRVYFATSYAERPIVVLNVFSTAYGTAVQGGNARLTEPTYFDADILRSNNSATTVGYLAIGKKASE